MTAAQDLLARLRPLLAELRAQPAMGHNPIDLAEAEITLLMDALERPEVRQSCADTTNYPIMAERALRLIERNRICLPDAIDGVCHLVDCAGLDNAKKAVEDDDDVPF